MSNRVLKMKKIIKWTSIFLKGIFVDFFITFLITIIVAVFMLAIFYFFGIKHKNIFFTLSIVIIPSVVVPFIYEKVRKNKKSKQM